jgi:SPP1 family predicted phage head-tail adaptor
MAKRIALDKRIIIQRETFARNADTGQIVGTWMDLVTVWGAILSKKGTEKEVDNQIVNAQDITFHMRWRYSLTVQDRMKYNDKIYDVQAIREIDRKSFMEVDAVLRDSEA